MTDSPSSLIETTAKAIYDADPIIATDGSVVVPWELPTGDAVAAHDPGRHRIVCDQARAALLAIEEAGYAFVPAQPTPEMLEKGWWTASLFHPFQSDMPRGVEEDVWDAMLSSRPRVT